MSDIKNPFEVCGVAAWELISGRIFDGPETKTVAPAPTKAVKEETDESKVKRKPAASLEHVLEPVDDKPKRKKTPDPGSDAVAAAEAAKAAEEKT